MSANDLGIVQVRSFEEADRDALRSLFKASRQAAFTWDTGANPEALDFNKSTVNEKVLVALIDGKQVGFASIWEPDSFLHNLFVHPDCLRQGIGTALLARCADHFSKAPTLKCLKANARAMRFYTAQGWRVIGDGESADGPYALMEGPRTARHERPWP
jgi:GNAT superfamily N-acetyltransferase